MGSKFKLRQVLELRRKKRKEKEVAAFCDSESN